MDLWDRDAIDLLGPAFIDLDADGSGCFRFIAVEGDIDARLVGSDGRVEFSWDGNDECDPAFGRGWVQLEADGSLRGRIFFHGGDDSAFLAVAAEEKPAPRR